jgi:hypothetical protein
MKLIISVWWLHLCQKIQENATPTPHFQKGRPLILPCEKVPICAARWCSLCKFLMHSKSRWTRENNT